MKIGEMRERIKAAVKEELNQREYNNEVKKECYELVLRYITGDRDWYRKIRDISDTFTVLDFKAFATDIIDIVEKRLGI